jgi:hypothetical protein
MNGLAGLTRDDLVVTAISSRAARSGFLSENGKQSVKQLVLINIP